MNWAYWCIWHDFYLLENRSRLVKPLQSVIIVVSSHHQSSGEHTRALCVSETTSLCELINPIAWLLLISVDWLQGEDLNLWGGKSLKTYNTFYNYSWNHWQKFWGRVQVLIQNGQCDHSLKCYLLMCKIVKLFPIIICCTRPWIFWIFFFLWQVNSFSDKALDCRYSSLYFLRMRNLLKVHYK